MTVDHPLIQSVVVPFIVAFVATRLLASLSGERAAAASIGCGSMVGLWLVLGSPVWPAAGSLQKLPWIMTATTLWVLIAGIASPATVDAARTSHRGPIVAVALAGSAAIITWLAWPSIADATSGIDPGLVSTLIAVIIVYLFSSIALLRAPADGANRATLLLSASVALTGASVMAGSLSLAQTAAALAASLAGFALWSWPRPRVTMSDVGAMAAGLATLAIALALLMTTDVRAWSLLVAATVFGANEMAQWLRRGRSARSPLLEPLLIATIALVPAIIAIGFAAPATGGSATATDDAYR